MMKPALLLTILAAFSGALHIYFDYQKNIKATYLFKPLVCALLIVMVLLFGQEASSAYRNLIVVGLFFSMLGDIFLMLENEKFIQGLVSFLIAHVIYIVAFAQFVNFSEPLPWTLFAGLALIAFFMWRYLYPSLGKMNVPVIIYIAAITSMCAMAGIWLYQSNDGNYQPALYAFVGSIWFMASDTNLSINKFKKPYHASQFVTLSTYYVAQILIAWSVLFWVQQ